MSYQAPQVASRSLQNRTILLLSLAQIFSGLGAGAAISVGALLAVKLSGSTSWGGSVTTIMTLGAAVSSLPLARWALKHGRRKTLGMGLLIAAVGALTMITAGVLENFPVLLVGAATLGVGSAVNLQARFAATDLSAPEHRARDLSLVVWTTTIGSVAGPNLLAPAEKVGAYIGLPEFTGIFLFSTTGMVIAALIILLGLRPDPYFLARTLAAQSSTAAPANKRYSIAQTLKIVRTNKGVLQGLASILTGHGIMVAIMAMTSVHLEQHGAALNIIGLTISLHIAGMYAFSPLVGILSDRAGSTATTLIGFSVITLGLAAAGFGQESHLWVTVGLILLGLGWSATSIAGSAQIVSSVDPQDRVSVQGVSDTLMSLAGALGGLLAGLGLTALGYGGLNAVAAAIIVVSTVTVLRLRKR